MLGVCAGCSSEIAGRYLAIGEKRYHPGCFVCSACGDSLSGQHCDNGGTKYCVPCYERAFAPKCVDCGEPILGASLKVAEGFVHPKCFTCKFCDTQIRSGQPFVTRLGKRCCGECKGLFCGGSKGGAVAGAPGCGQFCELEPGRRVVLDGIRHPFHKACIKCSVCGVCPVNPKVFNGAVLCVEHLAEAQKTTVDRSKACGRCNLPIDGRALFAVGRQWHPNCFLCAGKGCTVDIRKKFFEVKGQPYCLAHAKKAAKSGRLFGSPGRKAAPAVCEPVYSTMEPDDDGGAPTAGVAAASAAEEPSVEADYDGADFNSGERPDRDAAPARRQATEGDGGDDGFDDYDMGDFDASGGGTPRPGPRDHRDLEHRPLPAPPGDADYDNGDFAGEPIGGGPAGFVAPSADAAGGAPNPAAVSADVEDAPVQLRAKAASVIEAAASGTVDVSPVKRAELIEHTARANGRASGHFRESILIDHDGLGESEDLPYDNADFSAAAVGDAAVLDVEAEVRRRVEEALIAERAKLEAKIRAEITAEISAGGDTGERRTGTGEIGGGGDGGGGEAVGGHTGPAGGHASTPAPPAPSGAPGSIGDEKRLLSGWLGGTGGDNAGSATAAGVLQGSPQITRSQSSRTGGAAADAVSPEFIRVLEFVGASPKSSPRAGRKGAG